MIRIILSIIVLLILSGKDSLASVKSIGPGFSPPIEIPQDLSMKINSQLENQKFNDLGFSVLLSCIRSGHKNFKGTGRISCVAIGAQKIPEETTKKTR